MVIEKTNDALNYQIRRNNIPSDSVTKISNIKQHIQKYTI